MEAAVQLDREDPKNLFFVVDTGARPSAVREDVLPENWRELAARALKSTRACDASRQMLKACPHVELSIYVNRKPMQVEFLVLKALLVPVIVGVEFQKVHVKAIYPGVDASPGPRGTSPHPRKR